MQGKFRVWCVNKKEWESDPCLLSPDGVLFHQTRNGFWTPLRPETHKVVWATGHVEGKERIEVYENDICQGNWPYATLCIVAWDKARCGFYLQPLDGPWKRAAYDKGYKLNGNRFKVIGNALENPDLVQAG
jgi:hypothetical protein